jgi:hypothetical protein
MTNEDPHSSRTGRDPLARRLLASAVIALVIIGITLFAAFRDGDLEATSSSPSTLHSTTSAPSVTTTLDSRNAVVARLQEILEVREQAFRERDEDLFEEVYTSDCSCLRAGRSAIAALKKERVRWQSRSISIEVQSANSINNRLWEVVALFISDSFRIETEEGTLVRQAPAERIRYRFLLVRSSDEDPWRLGSASPVEG